MFTMRFDMRIHPDGPASGADLYAAALEMAAWGEERGCIAIQVSEHHASSDGYLPAPLLLASAIASRTARVPIQIAASLVPLHDPIELAEQMAVLDLISGGRVSHICAIGYRAEEYAMFGREMKGRGKRLEECIAVMRKAWEGEPFEYEGRAVQVTPKPQTPGGPLLMLGGGSPIVVRRAARLGLGMITQGGDPGLEQLYRDACAEAGTTPGLFVNPPASFVGSAFVADDPDRAWAEWGKYLLHDAQMYGAWMANNETATKSTADTVEALRAEPDSSYRIFSPDEAVAHMREAGVLSTQPLCGGLPPEHAWQSLEMIVSKVLPALQPSG